MDTIVEKNHKDVILTIVERKTNMLFVSKLKYSKDAEELSKEVVRLLSPCSQSVKTITTDNGT